MVSQPLWQEIMKLSVDERWDLLDRLRESLPMEADGLPPLTEAQKAELDRRLADLERYPNEGEDWETVRARIERSL